MKITIAALTALALAGCASTSIEQALSSRGYTDVRMAEPGPCVARDHGFGSGGFCRRFAARIGGRDVAGTAEAAGTGVTVRED